MAYIAAGPGSDHECTDPGEVLEKARLGMMVMIRGGRDSRQFAAMLSVITDRNCGQFALVTDDRPADDLKRKGHLDHLLRMAAATGLDPTVAIRLVTLNPARYFGLHHRGAVAPGYIADIVIVDDLSSFKAHLVLKAGRPVAHQGKLDEPIAATTIRRSVLNTVALREVSASDLTLRFRSPNPKARIMELVPGTIFTAASVEEVPVEAADGSFRFDPAADLSMVLVLERHRSSGHIGKGLVRGFGLRRGAIASSFAHDAHNIICVAADPESALTAVRALKGSGGGYVVAVGDAVKGLLNLPVGGLMHDGPYEDLLKGRTAIRRAVKRTGCRLEDPFFDLSFLSLAVVPDLKITDRGLYDVGKGEFVELEVS